MDGLNDILIPDSVPLWPPGPAWFVLAIALLAALLWLGWRKYRRYLHNAYRREAIAAVDRVVVRSRDSDRSPADLTNELSDILKRVAIVSFGRLEVADLSGARWIDFLNRTGGQFDGRVARVACDRISTTRREYRKDPRHRPSGRDEPALDPSSS